MNMNKRILGLIVITGASAIAVGLLIVVNDDAVNQPSPSQAEQAALDWVLRGTRSLQAAGSQYSGPFPDQGMEGDPIPSYVVFEREAQDVFYVVFHESEEIYTARYRLDRQVPKPKLQDLRLGYGWFDLSRPLERSLEVWKLEGGHRWVWQPHGRGVASMVGAAFAVDGYSISPSGGRGGRGHMYVDGSSSNTGDASGRAECYLIYGSQSELIEGPYLKVTVAPGTTLSVSGNVRFPRPLDDNESGGVECRAQESSQGGGKP